jgi:TP901 family phage tail tape measure protein
MSVQLEDLVARLRLDTSGLASGMAQAQSTMASAGQSMSSTGKKLTAGVTLPLAGIAAASVKLSADFDKTMRQVEIATGGPSKALRELALQMGAETAFSAKDASDAMLELAKGGMTAAQIQGGALEATMTAAAAGGITLGEASTLVSNAMQTFGLRTKDAGSIAVALAGAANASSASMGSLQQGLQAVGGVAASAGLSLNETVGALSAFDAQGLKGSDAGTSLKAMLNTLIPTTEKATKAMEGLGLDFVKGNGEFENMTNIAGQLQKALGPLPEAQRNLALETIFGADGMRAATALMNTGAEGMGKYLKATRDTAVTQELANAAMEGTSGAIERAKGSLETAAIMIGNVLAPYVEMAAGVIEDLANKFTALPGPVQAIIVGVAGLVAVVGPALMMLGFLATTLAAVSLPVVGVVAALVALGAALVIAYQRSAEFRAVVHQALGAVASFITSSVVPAALGIRDAFQQMVSAVTPIVMQLVGVIRSNLPQIRATFESVWSTVKTVVLSTMSIIRSTITITTAVIKAVWSVFGDTILSTIRRVFPALLQVIRGAMDVIQGIFRTVAAVLRGDWGAAWDGIRQIASGALQMVVGAVKGGLALVLGAFNAILDPVQAVFSRLWDRVQTVWRNGIDLVVNLATGLRNRVVNALEGLVSSASDIAGNVVDALAGGIRAAASRVADAAREMVSDAIDAAKSVAEIFSPSKVFEDIGRQISLGMALGIEEEDAGVTAASDAIKTVIGDLGTFINTRLDKVFDGKKLTRHVERVKDGMKEEAAAVRKAAGNYDRLVNTYNRVREAGAAAQDRLAELQEQQADYAAQVAANVVDFGSVVGLGARENEAGDTVAATAGTIIEDLRGKVAEAGEFAHLIATLTAQGLNDTTIRQLLAAGVEGGLATARAISEGGVAAINEINLLTQTLTATGVAMGQSVSVTFYQAGIDSAAAVASGIAAEAAASEAATQLLLDNLGARIEANEERINRKMRKLGKSATDGLMDGLLDSPKIQGSVRELAKQITRQVKDALGIRSPSKVFAALGVQTAQGLVVGLDSMRRNVAAAGLRVGRSAIPPGTGSRFGGTAANGSAMQIRVFIGETELTDIVRTEVGGTLAPLTVLTRQGGF